MNGLEPGGLSGAVETAGLEPSRPAAADPMTVLGALRDTALDLLRADTHPPRALRVRVGEVSLEIEWPETPVPRRPAPAGPSSVDVAQGAEEAAGGYVTAPAVGVFYRRPLPEADPFVGEGDLVAPGQQIAIIEAMKLMLPVEVDRACRITEVLVVDGQSVAFGDRLFAVAELDEDSDEQ